MCWFRYVRCMQDLGALAGEPVEYDSTASGDNAFNYSSSPPTSSLRFGNGDGARRRRTSPESSSPASPRRKSGGRIINFLFNRSRHRSGADSPTRSPAPSRGAAEREGATAAAAAVAPSPLMFPPSGRRGSIGYEPADFRPLQPSRNPPLHNRSKSIDPRMTEPWSKSTTTSVAATAGGALGRNIDRRGAAGVVPNRRNMAVMGVDIAAGARIAMNNGTTATNPPPSSERQRRVTVGPLMAPSGLSAPSVSNASVERTAAGATVTPMSRLLKGSDSDSPGNRSGTQTPSSTFGPDDFMQLFRSRAYSADLKDERVSAAVFRARRGHNRVNNSSCIGIARIWSRGANMASAER